MRIHINNVNLSSNSGPNSFGRKLVRYFLTMLGVELSDVRDADVCLSFISSSVKHHKLFQRLDGIYFNTDQDWMSQNRPIFQTYQNTHGVIFQSNFSRTLVTKFFGEHDNACVIRNGADIEAIQNTPEAEVDCDGDVWVCASSWRPHKRLNENIRYFLEHSDDKDILIVAGNCSRDIINKRIIYTGDLSQEALYSVYKRAKYFIHLGWLDNCPNVVCDAQACGCQVICSSSGGTPEVAGPNAIVIQEQEEWDFTPTKLYNPPPLNFDNKITNEHNQHDISMVGVAKYYIDFMSK